MRPHGCPFSARRIVTYAMLTMLVCAMLFGQAPSIAWEDVASGSEVAQDVTRDISTSALRQAVTQTAERLRFEDDALGALWDTLTAVSVDRENKDAVDADNAACAALRGDSSTPSGVTRAFVLVATELGVSCREDRTTEGMPIAVVQKGDEELWLDVASAKAGERSWVVDEPIQNGDSTDAQSKEEQPAQGETSPSQEVVDVTSDADTAFANDALEGGKSTTDAPDKAMRTQDELAAKEEMREKEQAAQAEQVVRERSKAEEEARERQKAGQGRDEKSAALAKEPTAGLEAQAKGVDSVSKATVAPIPDQAYTGSKVEPQLNVELGGKTLKPHADYTVTYANNVKAGKATATIKGVGKYTGTKQASFSIVAPSVGYMVHVQTFGDQPWKKDGQTSGTTGQSKRLEAIWMRLAAGFPVAGGIRYRTHVQTYGWQGWSSDGAESGTHGQSKRLECIQICLTGDMAKKYDVWYRVHSQRYGWMGWARNGDVAGTAGKALRLEGIQVTLVPKDGPRPSSADQQTRASFVGVEGVSVAAHVQSIGWMSPVNNGGVAGTTGMGKRVEALRVGLVGARVPGNIQVNAHVQGIGWQGYTSGVSGTTGQSRRIEAMRMRLTGEAASTYDLYYRVHVRGVGWLSWASADVVAGSTGLGLRVEAVQVRLVAKGAAAPDSGGSAYPQPELSHLSVRYSVWQRPAGWSGDAADGQTIGDASANKPVEGMSASLQGDIVLGGIQYRSHVQGTGWMGWKADGAESGRPSSGKRMEAIQMRLTGTAAGMYCIWYRVNVQGTGWMGWAHDGQSAGTEGLARRIQAVQVRLVGKGVSAPGSTANAFVKAGVKWGLGQPANTREVSGFGGYVPSRGVTNAINNEIAAIRGRGYDVGFVMMDLSSLRGIAYNCDNLFYGASSIKAPYIASVVHQHPDALQRCQDDIQETLFYSWDYNYNQVYDAYGNDPMTAFCKEAGASESIASALPWVNYSARDLARLWGRTYELYDKSPELEVLGTWCERPNVSTIHTTLGSKYRTRSKGGWISDGGICYSWLNGGGPEWDVTDDGGIVYARNGAYVMAILSSIPADHDALNGLTAAIDAAHSEM